MFHGMKRNNRLARIGFRTILFVTLSIFAVSCAAAEGESEAPAATPEPAPAAEPVVMETGPTIWQGERITFTKADGADPTAAANQDRITESVWITRGNDGGQIFNIVESPRAIKTASPQGTLWALGTTADLADLDFRPFRSAVVSPKDVVGKDLVMFIEAEEIYLDVRFLSWTAAKGGGFSYERSTPGE
jgi:hypothetical protein